MRSLALLLLDDSHGITAEAWRVLCDMMEDSGEYVEDIIQSVKYVEGRVFLPEN